MPYPIRIENNPFQPGYGVQPPVMAGRDQLKKELQGRLYSLSKGICNPTAIVLTGPRGCGKTTLLGWILAETTMRHLPLVVMASDSITSPAAIAREMARQFPPKLLESVRGFNLNIGPTGGSIDLIDQNQEVQDGELKTWMEALGSEGTGGVILVDEAHTMSPKTGHIFYTAAQSVAMRHSLMLVIAGTPDLKMVLRRSHVTFSERLQEERIGRLSRCEALRALTEPFDSGVIWQEDALTTVIDETQNYPYFIQLWGKSIWNQLASIPDMYKVDMNVVSEAKVVVAEQLAKLYKRRFKELVETNLIVPIAEMVWRVGEGGKPSEYDFELAVQHLEVDMDRTMAQQKLLHSSFVWEPSSDIWEYGIPSLDDHIRSESARHLLTNLRIKGIVPALQSVSAQFGTSSNYNRLISREKLLDTINNNQHANGISPQAYLEDPLDEFLSLNLLAKGDSPDHIRMMAPLLVQATVTEAVRQGLAPEVLPNADTPSTSY